MPSEAEQTEITIFLKDTFTNYEKLNTDHRVLLTDIYEEYRSFKQKRRNAWSSIFKVNYAHTIINKTLPRLIAKNPRWLVSKKSDEFIPEDRLVQ